MALVLQKRAFNRSRNELVNSEEAIEAVRNDPLGDNNYEAVRFKFNYFTDRLKLYETRRDDLKTAVQEDELDVLISKESDDLHKKLSSWLLDVETSLKLYQILRGKKTEDYEGLPLDNVADEYINPIDEPFPDEVLNRDEFTEDTCDEEEELKLHNDETTPSSMETGTECPGPDTMVTTEDDDFSDKSNVSDDLKILDMTTPELELGKDPPELDYDGSVEGDIGKTSQ
ncbi:hypothetical protein M8J77_010836 [Diaphorina citri]|nr:hypothetical protein M8J77_010836 [Diaphorina citri]